MISDTTVFPDAVYQDTILRPLFDGVSEHYAEAMTAVNQAHLVMLESTGILSSKNARQIARALNAIGKDTALQGLSYSEEYEDYFFVVEAELKKRLGADIGGMLHTARSRNDIDHTVFKMTLRTHCDKLLEQCIAVAAVLIARIRDGQTTLIVAYTHGQPAQPSTFAHYLAAILEVLLSDIQRLLDARLSLDLCPMGAAAITTTGFNIDRHLMADLLGFSKPKQNSYGCIASVDYITGLYSAMKLVFLHLGRVVQDMAFWSSFEVGQLYVPNSLVQISSIMPQKRNPVPIEHLRHLASVTCARCDMMVNTMHNTPFTDMNDSEGEVQAAGYIAFDSAGRMLRLLTSFIESVQINTVQVKKNADAACITITELADTLVRESALSFRQAHEIASATANAVITSGVTLGKGYDAFQAAFTAAVNYSCSLSEQQFKTTVSLENFVSVRSCFGGPGKAAMIDAIECYSEELARLKNVCQISRQQITEAKQARNQAFNALGID